MKRLLALALLFLGSTTCGWVQVTSPFALSVQPLVAIPLGPKLSGGTPLYTIGGGASLKAEFTPDFASRFFGGLGLDAWFLPLNGTGKAATFVSVAPALGVQFYPLPRFGVRLSGFGGMYAGIIEAGSIFDPLIGASLDFGYQVRPALAVTLGGSYSHHFTSTDPALLGLAITAGLRYYIGGSRADLRIEPAIQPIFPVFYGHYDNHPAGTVALRNNSMGPIQNVRVSLFVKEYMTTAKPSAAVAHIPRGGEAAVALNALFTSDLLSVTEQKKVAGELSVAYTYFGTEVTSTVPVTLTIQPRNGMTWAQTAQAASFVTVNDERVRNFAAPYAADARESTALMINWRFRVALALFEALRLYGVGYVADAATPYLRLSEQAEAVDLLRFPVETLVAKAGDCDDLSILYAALLESANIQAAFITTPGHIFVGFNLGLEAQAAADTFSNKADLIFRDDGSVWMPVEVTAVREGFQRSWKAGVQQWTAAAAGGQAEFVPLAEAWKDFPAVDTGRVLQGAISAPGAVRVYQAASAALSQFATAEIKVRAEELLARLKQAPTDATLFNRLGVLYARFGLLDEARQRFESITKTSKDVPAATLVNLGNLSYLEGKYQEACDHFDKALQRDAQSAAALLGKARAAYELGEMEQVRRAYDMLLKTAPNTAIRYAYLDPGASGSGRASTTDREVWTWNE